MAATEATSFPSTTTIGRYFTVVSLIPSSVFVAYLVLLVRSGAWGHGTMHFASAIGDLNLRDLAVFSIGSLLSAMTLHPLQFAVIQIFEGFWGSSKIATKLALWNVMRHRERAALLHRQALEGRRKLQPKKPGDEPSVARAKAPRTAVLTLLATNESSRQSGSYPHELQRIMPTRLGNVLRRYEVLAGRHYGLDSIATVPRLLQVADSRDVAYVHNQRMQMELALRTSVLACAAAVLTVAFMWYHGWWILLALAPYAVAYITYRGAVVVAHEYGTALAVLVDLNRFSLYDRLHLKAPDSLTEEKQNNIALTAILRLDAVDLTKRLNEAQLDYAHPENAAPSTSPDSADNKAEGNDST